MLDKHVKLRIISIEDGSKHLKIRNLLTLDWIPVAGSPSDCRSIKNFEGDLCNLINYGKGLIYAKTGRFPIKGQRI